MTVHLPKPARPFVCITLMLWLCPDIHVHAQTKRIWHWYFGNRAGVDFSSGVPVADTSGQLVSVEGCASISDTAGNLLFYTNGETVWNRNHAVMQNGSGLSGFVSSIQSSLAVPRPGSPSEYYLFTPMRDPHGVSPIAHLSYSIIDMNPNGGLGAVTAAKDVYLLNGGTETLAGTMHCNTEDYWIVTRRKYREDTLQFYAYLLSAAGLSPPVVSSFPANAPGWDNLGYLKFSQDGKKMVLGSIRNPIRIFNFDTRTGALSFSDSIALFPEEWTYASEFSPDKTKLYASIWSGDFCYITQYDLTASDIPASRVNLRSIDISLGSMDGYGFTGTLQTGPDQKIYVSRREQDTTGWRVDSLDAIQNPNAAGIACNYLAGAVPLRGRVTSLGLPNFVSQFTAPVPPVPHCPLSVTGDSVICRGDSTVLTAQYGSNYRWALAGAPGHIIGTGSVIRVSPSAGVTYLVYSGGDTARFRVYVNLPPAVWLGNDTSLCEGRLLALHTGLPGANHLWQDGSTGATHNVAQPGMYRVRVTTPNGCTGTDSIRVFFHPLPAINLGNDALACTGDTVRLDASGTGLTYRWQDGSVLPTYTITQTGTYSVQVTDSNGCQNTDAVTLKFLSPPSISLPDSTLCIGDVWEPDVATPHATYLWQDYSTLPSFVVRTEGTYRVTVSNPCGTDVDTFETKYRRCLCELYIPNTFTPEENSLNERFGAIADPACRLVEYRLILKNRWGQTVFETTDADFFWDGNFLGNSAPVDCYTYLITYRYENKSEVSRWGKVLLLR